MSRCFLLFLSFIFFTLTLFLLLTPIDESFDEYGANDKSSHPCPYADILGLDENSVNPHTPSAQDAIVTHVEPPSHLDEASQHQPSRSKETTTIPSLATAPASTAAPVPVPAPASDMNSPLADSRRKQEL